MSQQVYYSDSASGLLSTSQGKRLIVAPDLLINSIHQTLLSEVGELASMAFYTFGFSWGKSFYASTRKEIELYYETPISQMNATEFFATIQQLWRAHGLGKVIVDFSFTQEGLLLVTIENSGISIVEEKAESKSFSVEAGFLAGWFSAQTNQDLSAYATNWNAKPRRTQYLIGAKSQIEQIEQNSSS
ncbi:MAG: hypothetical protein HC935_05190 [Pseudanabaena sp. SU_2_4]|nr:hypothetical protein [Pseudanabaena sp. SU_2_4]